MINPIEINKKAKKLWTCGRILQAELNQEILFPWYIKFKQPSASQLVSQFNEIKQAIQILEADSKKGYQIIYKTINHRQLGQQQIPCSVTFNQQIDLLNYLGKQDTESFLLKLAQQTIEQYPALAPWINKKTSRFMQYVDIWQKLFNVCDYFIQNPMPHCYLRELDIIGIDTKFIENQRKILTELLDLVLPENAINKTITGLSQHGFERRYGLKFDPPLIRLRLLDAKLNPIAPLNDLSLPLSQLAAWVIPCENVFISENKINGLSFPLISNSMIIFGLGYGIESLAAIPWLKQKKIYYWGDIDSHGFSILNRLRQIFPQVIALMMDTKTFHLFQDLAVIEPIKSRCSNQLNHLTAAEQQLYQQLQASHQRLEQERLPMGYVMNNTIIF